MNNSEEIVTQFYQAFKNMDAERMVSFYSDEVKFNDPAFGILNGESAKDMWRMLIQRSKDLAIEYKIIEVLGNKVITAWEAKYTFGGTGRKVYNKIRSTITISNSKIIIHKDEFNLYTWSKQALGITGLLIGWTGFFKRGFQKKANTLLTNFQANKTK